MIFLFTLSQKSHIFAVQNFRGIIITPKINLKKRDMKKGIHPESYRTVVFKDISTEDIFLVRSCANTKETITLEDGNEYPLFKLEISSKSHPFYTGKMKFVDSAGRIDKFKKKFAKFAKK